LKTFYGLRKEYFLEVSIEEQIDTLIQKLIKSEEDFFKKEFLRKNDLQINNEIYDSEIY